MHDRAQPSAGHHEGSRLSYKRKSPPRDAISHMGEDAVVYHLLKRTCKNVQPEHVACPVNVDVNGLDVDTFDARGHDQNVVLARYAMVANLFTAPGLHAMLPRLECTWKSASCFYIKSVPVARGTSLQTAVHDLTVHQLLLLLSEVCKAVAVAHLFSVPHTCIHESSVIITPDLAEASLKQFGGAGQAIGFEAGRAMDTAMLSAMIGRLAAARFIDARAAQHCLTGEGVPAGTRISAAANELWRQGMASMGVDRQLFATWVDAMRDNVLRKFVIVSVPVDCTDAFSTIRDVHAAVEGVTTSVESGATDLPLLPVFHPHDAADARGQGPSADIVARFFSAVVKVGALVPHDGGLWPSPEWSSGLPCLGDRQRDGLFRALGFMIGYAMCMGIGIPQPLAASVVCIPLCTDAEFRGTESMAPRCREAIRRCMRELALLRRGFAPFRAIVRSSGWSVQQLYALFVDHSSERVCLSAFPNAYVLKDMTPAEEAMFTAWAATLDPAGTEQFVRWATGFPVLTHWDAPIVVHKSAPSPLPLTDVRSCIRTVTLPHEYFADAASLACWMAQEIQTPAVFNWR